MEYCTAECCEPAGGEWAVMHTLPEGGGVRGC